MVPSEDTEKSKRLSGESANPFILLVWPDSLVTCFPVLVEYRRTSGTPLPRATTESCNYYHKDH